MTDYEKTLLAYGMPANEARFHAWDQERAAFRNRELPGYGRQYEAEQIADAAPTTDIYEA